MKKFILAFLFAMTLAVVLCSCGSSAEDKEVVSADPGNAGSQTTVVEAGENDTEDAVDSFTYSEPKVVLDNEYAKVSILGYERADAGEGKVGFIAIVEVENKTEDNRINAWLNDVTVDGYVLSGGIGDGGVDPKEKTTQNCLIVDGEDSGVLTKASDLEKITGEVIVSRYEYPKKEKWLDQSFNPFEIK